MTTFAPHDKSQRKIGIGTSDASVIMNANPYKTRVELWQEKSGLVVPKDDFIERAFWGTQLEESILRGIPEVMTQRGENPDIHKIRKDGRTYWHNAKINENKFLYGHLDGRIGTDIAEIKHQGGLANKAWDNYDIPPMFYWQGICALLVCENAQVWRIYSLCNGNIIYRTIHKEFVQDDIDLLLDSATEFWSKNVLEKTPPEAVNERDIRLVHTEDKLTTVVITSEIKERLAEAKRLQDKADLLEDAAKSMKLKAKIALGNADEVVDEDGTVLYTYKYVKARKTVDNQMLKTEYPEVYEKCLKTGEPSRRFTEKKQETNNTKI